MHDFSYRILEIKDAVILYGMMFTSFSKAYLKYVPEIKFTSTMSYLFALFVLLFHYNGI